MTSVTNIKPRVETAVLAKIFGLACMLGGLLWLVFNLSEDLNLPFESPLAQLSLGVLLLVGLMGGPLGLLYLRSAGTGRTGKVGWIGAIAALLGLASDLVGTIIESGFGVPIEKIGFFYAAGALLVGVGMLLLGVAALLGRRLAGWRRFAPLLVGLYYAAMIPVQVVFFIIPNGLPSNTLLAFWGLTWLLLGCAISSETRRRETIGTQAN